MIQPRREKFSEQKAFMEFFTKQNTANHVALNFDHVSNGCVSRYVTKALANGYLQSVMGEVQVKREKRSKKGKIRRFQRYKQRQKLYEGTLKSFEEYLKKEAPNKKNSITKLISLLNEYFSINFNDPTNNGTREDIRNYSKDNVNVGIERLLRDIYLINPFVGAPLPHNLIDKRNVERRAREKLIDANQFDMAAYGLGGMTDLEGKSWFGGKSPKGESFYERAKKELVTEQLIVIDTENFKELYDALINKLSPDNNPDNNKQKIKIAKYALAHVVLKNDKLYYLIQQVFFKSENSGVFSDIESKIKTLSS
jgi:hypothetical protein